MLSTRNTLGIQRNTQAQKRMKKGMPGKQQPQTTAILITDKISFTEKKKSQQREQGHFIDKRVIHQEDILIINIHKYTLIEN